ncbi:MAG: NAD(P)-dependent oxidoreductase [Planctomycetota bacterium]|nr:NAD(P)-dependent oxidoreductase [Planctomycetota bacterium]
MPATLSVLVTGSGGRVGRAVCAELLRRGHRVRGFDLRPTPGLDDARTGDLKDVKALREAAEGMTGLVHLAAVPDDADFMSLLLPNNVVGLFNVMEAAREAGIGRVVLASTGQMVSGHEGPWPVTPEMPGTPTNWYASTKALAEAAGCQYARRHGMKVVALRLGWCPRDQSHIDQIKKGIFGQDIYLSSRDAGRLFACALETQVEFKYACCFGTSKPIEKPRFCIESAKRLLGYEPQDRWPQGAEEAGKV